MENLSVLIGIATGFISLGTAVIGIGAFLRASARKEYASQRDIGHLKNNQQQLTENVKELWRQGDERFDSIDRQLDRLEMHLTGSVTSRPVSGHQIGKPSR